jgi:RNA polymerase sigma-70 factor (ECF subfamily)
MSEQYPTDEELIGAFRESGDARILSGLVREHVPRVRTMIFRMVLNESDADDLTQEVFLRAFRGIAKFRGTSMFSTWLYQIAMNATRSFLSQRKRPRPMPEEMLADQTDATSATPEQLAIAGELDGAVTAAIGSLPAHLRAAVVLTILQGMDVREAAKIERCATATMYWRVHKARNILKKLLEKHLL